MKLITYAALTYIFMIMPQLCAEGFVANTLVHKFGTRPSTIEQICDHVAHGKRQIVSSWHEQKNRWASQAVRRAGMGTVNCTITLIFDDNSDHDITCSPIQLFYDSRHSAWVEAYKLHAGDILLTESGNTIQLVDISLGAQDATVYALRVKKNHTFCVGYYRVLTHNKQLPLIPLALMARIGIAFGSGAAAGASAGSFFGPVSVAGGFTIGGVIGAVATCAAIGHELYQYRVKVGTYEIEQKLSSRDDKNTVYCNPCQTPEAPSKGTSLVNIPLPVEDIREQKGCGNLRVPEVGLSGGCNAPPIDDAMGKLPIGCGGIPAELKIPDSGCLVYSFAQGSENDNTPIKTVEEILKDCNPGKKTSGKTEQFEKEGGVKEAEQDFESLKLSNIRSIPKGKVGDLPDNRVVNVRDDSSFGSPTLEIFHKISRKKIKIRYINIIKFGT